MIRCTSVNPVLTHKGNIHSESRAAVAGGVTSFMEMPNTNPPTFTQELLADRNIQLLPNIARKLFLFHGRFERQSGRSDEDRYHEMYVVLKFLWVRQRVIYWLMIQKHWKVFFRSFHRLIAAHCEDESTIRNNSAEFKERYGEDVPIECHPLIRSVDGLL